MGVRRNGARLSGAGLSGRSVLVTGASGFVAGALLAELERGGARVRAALRSDRPLPVERAVVGDIGPDTDWAAALAGVEVVIHLAAHVHQMHGGDAAAYHRVNAAGTERLARQAAAAGVRRLVFLSSIKVNGEATQGRPFTEADPPAPVDPYGESKLAAERALARVAGETGLEVVVVRPPLVYGSGVRANFRALMRAVWRGIPLPLGRVDNRRSLIFRGNLASALGFLAGNADAAGRTFLASDGMDVSTPQLLRGVGQALGRPARLLPVPVPLLRAAARVTSRGDQLSRLIGSLQVDSGALRSLGWRPPFTLEQGLAETARDFPRSHER
jgi:nucleoside-diphosphate-sugar epimerase